MSFKCNLKGQRVKNSPRAFENSVFSDKSAFIQVIEASLILIQIWSFYLGMNDKAGSYNCLSLALRSIEHSSSIFVSPAYKQMVENRLEKRWKFRGLVSQLGINKSIDYKENMALKFRLRKLLEITKLACCDKCGKNSGKYNPFCTIRKLRYHLPYRQTTSEE